MSEAEQLLLKELDDPSSTVFDRLATEIARRFDATALRPLIREIVLMAELERENVRANGIGRSLLWELRRQGLRLAINEQGRLTVGPKTKVDRSRAAFIRMFQVELIRELNIEEGYKQEVPKPAANGVPAQPARKP